MLNKEVKECRWEIVNAVRNTVTVNGAALILIAYLLYLSYDVEKETEVTVFDVLETAGDMKERMQYLIMDHRNDYFDRETWSSLLKIRDKYTREHFHQMILMSTEENDNRVKGDTAYSTPNSIIQLSLKLLGENGTYSFADLCCGIGDSLVQIAEKNPNSMIYGCEINSENVVAAQIRSMFAENSFMVEAKDVFSLSSQAIAFDRIFMDHPFGLISREMGIGEKYKKEKYLTLHKWTERYLSVCDQGMIC